MSATAGWQCNGRRRAAPRWSEPARDGLRALLRALHRHLGKNRYRPERRYMRG